MLDRALAELENDLAALARGDIDVGKLRPIRIGDSYALGQCAHIEPDAVTAGTGKLNQPRTLRVGGRAADLSAVLRYHDGDPLDGDAFVVDTLEQGSADRLSRCLALGVRGRCGGEGAREGQQREYRLPQYGADPRAHVSKCLPGWSAA